MHANTLVTVVVLASNLASAVSIIPSAGSSTFPACAVSCAVLQQAQTTCQQTIAQDSGLQYENCFCTAPSLGQLYATTDVICADTCTAATDRQLLQSWFTTFCHQVGEGRDPLATSTATPTPTTTGKGGAATKTTGVGAGSAFTGSSAPAYTNGSQWIRENYRWVIMLVVLLIAFTTIGLLGTWLKKRHQRNRRNQEIAASGFTVPKEKGTARNSVRSSTATPDLWGPAQHMHATQGYQYARQDGVPPGGALGRGSKLRSHEEAWAGVKDEPSATVREF